MKKLQTFHKPIFVVFMVALFALMAQMPSFAANHRRELPSRGFSFEGAGKTRELEKYYGRLADRKGQIGVVVEFTEKPVALRYAEGIRQGKSPAATVQTTREALNVIRRTQEDFLGRARAIDHSTRELYRTQRAYNGLWVYVDAQKVSNLAKLPNVKALHPMIPKQLYHATSVPLVGALQVWTGSGPAPTGTAPAYAMGKPLHSVSPRAAGRAGYQGEGIKIGIIDTGIDYVHTNFGGSYYVGGVPDKFPTAKVGVPGGFPTAKVVGGYDFAGDNYDAGGTGAALIPVPDNDPMDCEGHGSHVAGSAAGFGVLKNGSTYTEGGIDTYANLGGLSQAEYIAKFRIAPGVAPKALLYALRVFGCTGSTNLTEQAIEWAMDPNGDGDMSDHLDVINMSLGSPYGSEYDTTAIASNNAAAAGVIVVASAGNEGDSYYITGTPAVANRAISVASSRDESAVVSAFEVTADTSGTFSGLPSQQYAVEADWTPTFGDVAGTLAMASPADGCSAIDTDVSGKIALIDRGSCNFDVKYENAVAAGAIGVLVANNEDGFPYGMGGAPAGSISAPAMMTSQGVGDNLKTAMATGAVTVKLTSAHKNAFTALDPSLTDTISSFSSRGVARGTSFLKPDIAAPGDTIFSTAKGTGNEGVSFSGTSMASPHVAGAMALLRQQHPTWTVAQLKALVMNTATHNIAAVAPQNRTPSRIGAGRLNALNSAGSDVVAFSASNPEGVSVSFGVQQVVNNTHPGIDKTLTQDITIQNLGSASQSYNLSFLADTFYSANPGVAFSVSPPTIAVPAGGTATATVTVQIDASLLEKTGDPTVDRLGGWRDWQAENGGYVVLTSTGSSPTLRVPVHISPRAASTMTTTEASLTIPSGAGTLALHPTGIPVDIEGADALDYSSAFLLELLGESPQDSHLAGTPLASADLQYIGVMTNDEQAFFGVSTYGNWDTLASTRFDIYVDTDEDGTDDYVIYNTSTGVGGSDVMLTVCINLKTDEGFYQNFVNALPPLWNTNLFNNNVAVFPVYLDDLGLGAGNPDFNFRIDTFHWDAPGRVDRSDTYHYNTASKAFDTNNPDMVDDLPFWRDDAFWSPTFDVAYNTANFTTNTRGLLLLHLHNGEALTDPGEVATGDRKTDLFVPLRTDSRAQPLPLTHLLTVNEAGTGAGRVTSTPAGINCGADCSERYDYGTSVTLTPMPYTGSFFAGWSGDADCRDGNVTMNADKTCTAIFTATPSSKLYFPHIDAKPTRRTEVAVINGSSTSVSGTLKGYSSTGSLIETKNISLPSHGRWEKDVAVEFANSRDIEYMIFESESDTAYGYAKSVDAGLSRVALPAVRELNAASDIYVSHIASDDYWWTAVGLLNTNTSSKMVSISFDDGRSTTVSLAAGEKKLLTIASLFAGIPQPGVRSAVIGNAGGVIGWELLGSRNGKQQDGLLLTGSASTTLYYPHIDCDGWWTGIVAYNESSAGAALTVSPYSKEGAPFPTITENVAGKGKYIGLASHLGLPAGMEWLRINSSQPLSGFELFGNADGRQLAAYSALRSGGAKWGILPKLEQEGWTGIVFVNAEESAASVTLNAYNDTGTVVATRLLALGGHAKIVNLAENIFSQAIAGATYIVYSSDRNVVGFQLNGSADGEMLDGLPTLGN